MTSSKSVAREVFSDCEVARKQLILSALEMYRRHFLFNIDSRHV